MIVLKQEINQVSAEILELAKWKLIAVAATAVAGLGWGTAKPDSDTGMLLLYSVGFLCAYVDWLCYRRFSVIHTIAAYIRNYGGTDAELLELKAYETAMKSFRNRGHFFISERWAIFVATLIFSLGLPVLGAIRYGAWIDFRLIIPAAACLANFALFFMYNRTRNLLIIA